MTSSVLLGIDVGQTGMRARVVRDGSLVLEGEASGVRTDEAVLPQVAAFAREIAAAAGGVDAVTAGISGLTSAEHDAAAFRTLLADERVVLTVIAHDSTTSYLGSLGDRWGAVVAAGTGVVTLAVGARRVARVDGWGHIMGDAGSGYWIGRAALEAVMRAHDGRGPATELTPRVRERWPDLESAYIALQADDRRVSVVASFAAAVADLAGTDAVARAISEAAAEELALSVRAALARVRDDGDEVFDVCALGGIFRSPVIRGRFAAAVARDLPTARLVEPEGDGLAGALSLAALPPGHPLLAHVSVAA
ncbi:BadF/BadG/BcrA/BcrD ATPase family protein [Microbacterium sp. X-17]|uniref:N-acetylglucosamine kinase n=1 Tax=Microbacterium sp. X-17 TaxID=3144404 RepID=UPI0031F5B0F4